MRQLRAERCGEALLERGGKLLSPLAAFPDAQEFCPTGFAFPQKSLLLPGKGLVLDRGRDLCRRSLEIEVIQDTLRFFLRGLE